jgi:FixJ family two-component response regulator
MVTFRLTVKAMKGGATEFLLKSFDEDDLVRAIDAAIAFDRRERAEDGSLRDLKSRYQRARFFLNCHTPRGYQRLSHTA